MLKELDDRMEALRGKLEQLHPETEAQQLEYDQLRRSLAELQDAYRPRTAADEVYLARHPARPSITDYIENLFTDFFEQRGDHFKDCVRRLEE